MRCKDEEAFFLPAVYCEKPYKSLCVKLMTPGKPRITPTEFCKRADPEGYRACKVTGAWCAWWSTRGSGWQAHDSWRLHRAVPGDCQAQKA